MSVRIKKLIACNFRVFKRVDVDLRDELSLIIGKNNSGKTSLLILFEDFIKMEINSLTMIFLWNVGSYCQSLKKSLPYRRLV